MIEYAKNLPPSVVVIAGIAVGVVSIILFFIVMIVCNELEEEYNKRQNAMSILFSGPIGWAIALVLYPIFWTYDFIKFVIWESR